MDPKLYLNAIIKWFTVGIIISTIWAVVMALINQTEYTTRIYFIVTIICLMVGVAKTFLEEE